MNLYPYKLNNNCYRLVLSEEVHLCNITLSGKGFF